MKKSMAERELAKMSPLQKRLAEVKKNFAPGRMVGWRLEKVPIQNKTV